MFHIKAIFFQSDFSQNTKVGYLALKSCKECSPGISRLRTQAAHSRDIRSSV